MLNAGSSSLKFALFECLANSTLAKVGSGLLERIGDPDGKSLMRVGAAQHSVAISACRPHPA